MPSAVVSTKRHYTTWRIPKGVPLLKPEDNADPGKDKPWSWECHWNTLTYWDESGNEHEIEGDDWEPDFKWHEEVENGQNEFYSSDKEEDEEEKSEEKEEKEENDK